MIARATTVHVIALRVNIELQNVNILNFCKLVSNVKQRF